MTLQTTLKQLISISTIISVSIFLFSFSLPLNDYEDDFKDAESLYNSFRSEFLEIKMVNAAEARNIVSAICEAEEADRKTASRSASSRAKSQVSSAYNSIKRIKEDTEDAIKKAEESLEEAKDDDVEYGKNKSKIEDYIDDLEKFSKDLKSKWTSIEKMTKSIRGANHPVVAWMLEIGQAAHEDRQEQSSFHAHEFSVGSAGRVDCLVADGDKLIVVELKPCNSRAVSKGISQLNKYIREIKGNWTKYKPLLVRKNSKFGKVTKISGRCDCYTICPIIDDQGEYEKGYVKWTKSKRTVSSSSL